VRRFDVLVHDLLPSAATQPAAEEALDFLDLAQLQGLLARGHHGLGAHDGAQDAATAEAETPPGASPRSGWTFLSLDGGELRTKHYSSLPAALYSPYLLCITCASTVSLNSHDPCFNVFLIEENVMTLVVHGTNSFSRLC